MMKVPRSSGGWSQRLLHMRQCQVVDAPSLSTNSSISSSNRAYSASTTRVVNHENLPFREKWNTNYALLGAFALATGGMTACGLLSIPGTTKCEASSSSESQKVTESVTAKRSDQEQSPDAAAVWKPDLLGISEADLNALVDEIMADPNITLAGIPDHVERQIYRSTVQLFFNTIYYNLACLNGMPLTAGHELRYQREKITTTSTTASTTPSSSTDEKNKPETRRVSWKTKEDTEKNPSTVDIDDAILDQMAERLLANKAVNQRFLPDQIERLLYANCLKVIFRLTAVVFESFHINACGHQIQLKLGKASTLERNIMERAAAANAVRAASSVTVVDLERLQEFARSIGGIQDDALDMSNLGFFQRLWEPSRHEFMISLHTSLYGLILAILDDLLANMEIHLFSDRLGLDIVPVRTDGTVTPRVGRFFWEQTSPTATTTKDDEKENSTSSGDGGGGGSSAFASFTIGLGMGISLMALALVERGK